MGEVPSFPSDEHHKNWLHPYTINASNMHAVDVFFYCAVGGALCRVTPVIHALRFMCGAVLEGRATGVLDLKAES